MLNESSFNVTSNSPDDEIPRVPFSGFLNSRLHIGRNTNKGNAHWYDCSNHGLYLLECGRLHLMTWRPIGNTRAGDGAWAPGSSGTIAAARGSDRTRVETAMECFPFWVPFAAMDLILSSRGCLGAILCRHYNSSQIVMLKRMDVKKLWLAVGVSGVVFLYSRSAT